MPLQYKKLGNYIREVDVKNTDLKVSLLLGVSIKKKFIPSIANIIGTDLSKYKIVRKGQFAYGPVTSRNGDQVSIALLEDNECIISTSYTVFEISKPEELLNEYLMLLFSKPEFDRYARYNSWGSAREIFSWDELCNTELYLPDIEEQKKIVREYQAIFDNKNIIEKENKILESLAYTIYTETIENCTEWHEINLGISTKISAGGDNPSDTTLVKTEKCQIPVYSNGVTDDGLYGYTSKAKINEESITISARGTIGYTALRMHPYTPIVRLISIIPNDNNMIEFLYMYFKYLKYDDDGSVQQQATKPYFEAMNINIPKNIVEFKNKIRPILNLIENNKQKCKLLERVLSLRLSTM